MGKKVTVKLRLLQKRDAGIVGKHSVAARIKPPMPADEGKRLHGEQVRADNGIVLPFLHKVAELVGIAYVRQIDRRRDAGGAVHLTGPVDHAEHLRRL